MHFGTDPKVKMRQAVEARILRTVVRDALKAGYSLTVYDGDDYHGPTDQAKIALSHLMETDEDYLLLLNNGEQIGWVRFVYGNDGYDVICDYSANAETESVLTKANAIADRLG